MPDPEEHARYLKSEGWGFRRRRALCRANWRCEKCGKGGTLHVHHLHYRDLGREHPDSLAALCPSCHGKMGNERVAARFEADLRRKRLRLVELKQPRDELGRFGKKNAQTPKSAPAQPPFMSRPLLPSCWAVLAAGIPVFVFVLVYVKLALLER